MINGLVVVVKKRDKFYTGGIKASKFVRYREIKKLSDLKFRDNYITLAAYLKKLHAPFSVDTILTTLKVDKMYVRTDTIPNKAKAVITPPAASGKSTEAAGKAYWAKFYPDCISCVKTCKQSHLLLSLHCPSRVAKPTKAKKTKRAKKAK